MAALFGSSDPDSPTFLKSIPGKISIVIGAIAIGLLIYVALDKPGTESGMEFGARQRVSAASTLRMSLPERMNQRSVEENLEVPEGVAGKIQFEGNTLVFDPEGSLTIGDEYTFRIKRTALTAANTPIGRDLEYVFEASGKPMLSAQMPPKDATDVPTDSRITLIFDRPMIPLTEVQGHGAERRLQDWNIEIRPPVGGRFRWLGTTTVEFVPDESLKAGTRYTVSVPAGISTLNGDKTEDDLSWNFETQRPRVVSVEPPPASRSAGPTTVFAVEFNQEMDLKRLIDFIVLKEDKPGTKGSEERKEARMEKLAGTGAMSIAVSDPDSLPVTLSYMVREDEEGKKTQDKTTVLVKPNQPLKLNTQYALMVKEGTRGAGGDLGSDGDYTAFVHTVGDLVVESTDFTYEWVNAIFTHPVDIETAREGIVMTPEPEGWKDVTFSVDDWNEGRTLSFFPTLKASTTYTVEFTTKLRDEYGQHLKKEHTFSFTTPAIRPQVFIHSNGEFGFFERAKPPVYYVNSINVSKLDVAFAKLSLPEFLSLRLQRRIDWMGTANLAGKAEYTTLSLQPKVQKNIWESRAFDVQKEVKRTLTPGLYALTVTAPEYKADYYGSEAAASGPQVTEHQFFAITDIALTLKYSGDRVLVWAVNMQTGAPVTGATVGIHALDGNTVLTGTTDAQGFFEGIINLDAFITDSNSWKPEFYVTAEKDGDFTFVSSDWTSGLTPGDFGLYEDFHGTDRPDLSVDTYLYTDRPVYRPGDTVHFKGIVRLRDTLGKFRMPTGERQAVFAITDANGTEVYHRAFPFSQFGTFNGDFTIAPEAALGEYTTSLQISPETDIGTLYENGSFRVLEYRKPEYRVDVTTPKEDYVDDEVVEATVEGAYYFGAPMGNAPVRWQAVSMDYFFNRYTDGWYSFSLEDAWCWFECDRGSKEIATGEGNLDTKGHMTIRVPVNIDDEGVSQVVSIEASVIDPSNQVVANRVSVPVHKSNVYVGVRTEDYVVEPGKEARIGIVTVDPHGKPLARQNVQLQLFARTWNTVRTKSVDGQYYYDNEVKDTLLRSSSATTGEDGKATAKIVIPNGGAFVIVAMAKDNTGHSAKASTSVYAWSNTYFNWPHANNNRIDVLADKPEYKVGEKALLLVKSPYQGKGVTALVTVEREGILSKKLIPVTSNAQSIEIPITEDMLPNAYVSVVIVKPRMGETFNEFGLDTGAPAFRVGYVQLLVETKKKQLSLVMKTDKERYGPGETVTVKLEAKTFDGKPAQAELSLSVVDMSVLALTGFSLPDLVEEFYYQRGLGVSTVQTLVHLIERFKPGSKGGGGGDPELKKRGNFKDTAYWNPSIVTDAKGEVTLTFTLPDNLTTWKLLALANTKEHTFGAVAEEIVETKKVILRPVRPRFAVHGDVVTLGAIVHNFLPEKKTFTVTLEGKGFEPTGSASQQVTVDPEGMQKLDFPVRIRPDSQAVFTFAARTDGAEDVITEKIPLYGFGVPQSVATNGFTEKSAKEMVLVPREATASEGKLSVTVSPTIATYLPGGLDYLVQFPYGCAEQTVSSFLPNLAVAKLEGFGAFQIADDQTIAKNIEGGLQRLYTFQRADGGFGYWTESTESYPYLSAYIVNALQKTKDAGYAVDAGVIARTRSYLQSVLRGHDLKSRTTLAERAAILFALGETGGVDGNLLRNLYDRRKELPLFAQAQLAMAFDRSGGGNQTNAQASKIIEEILTSAKVDARGAHFEEKNADYYDVLMHTNTRSTAIVLQALIRVAPGHPLVPDIIRHLLAVREHGHWDTTQSTAETIFALVEFLKSTGEINGNFTADISIDGVTVLKKLFAKENILTRETIVKALTELPQGEEVPVGISKDGTGRLYYDMLLSYVLNADEIEPLEEGIGITRAMVPVDSDVRGVPIGSTHRVTLTITVPADRNFVAVESPLPAGLEPIDLSLATTQQDEFAGEANAEPTNWYDYWRSAAYVFRHIEYRDDRVFLFAEALPAGVYEFEYLVRATTPGNFRLRPARVWEMYFPEIFGQTSGEWFKVTE